MSGTMGQVQNLYKAQKRHTQTHHKYHIWGRSMVYPFDLVMLASVYPKPTHIGISMDEG